ncbi:unnamed protein product [Diatraea saccharalis]|uniref:Angiotensin-converting enzyme n=1 Tax=Diatraea saccharalis TaxID=40085 RepID=A0A9N9RBI9_9NEOP|nr:unnamed protein product [Diatraea saccharalis]
MDFITHKSIDLDASIKNLNWTVQHMVKLAEDFYQSMGLPAMTPKFWRESVLEKKNGDTQCHGTAADMFQDDDYRLLYCADTTMEDLYVLHHELGHIHYYMAYANQPVLFRQANSALQESIGDAIFYGVMTPQHLHRLNLVNDTIGYSDSTAKPPEQKLEDVIERNDYHPEKLINNLKVDQMETNQNHKASQKYDIADNFYDISKTNEKQYDKISDSGFSKNNVEAKRIETFGDRIDDTLTMNMKIDKSDLNTVETLDLTPDELLLLKQALNKIPQIPYALVIDEYRWKYFEGGMDMNALNKEFWDLTLELQGIVPPEERDEQYFDVAAKFHVPDNTAYIRYFLSSFIQHQIFEALCRAAVFGRRDMTTPLPDTIIMNRCDIYGSKAAGKLLKDFMSRGHSQHWREILFATTGNTDITPLALQRYYRPLYNILERTVKKLNIPLGW